jgi:hypothetical protein
MAAFLHRFAGSPAAGPGGPSFVDVPPGHAFAAAIEWLASAGITSGHPDGTFRPDEPVSRQAMAKFLHRYDQLPA